MELAADLVFLPYSTELFAPELGSSNAFLPPPRDKVLLVAFRRGWEHLQVTLAPSSALVLAFSAESVWCLYERLPHVSVDSHLFCPLLFVVLGFCLFLRPDALLSVTWAQVVEVAGVAAFQYKLLSWKGRIVPSEHAPVLQFSLCGLPCLRLA
ncbi:hypothetical protein VaNZ11_001178 [Volvox africanus]|uniref:Uncharacterized protein n=1 Tax=Volvox africanus TaxID=51714 RepID=A0ABQ5RP42_9CHLO|nr:hypothetical protein VaNZ11_001178 [Volvox africanus]